ncbi:DUF4129 domain-containing protein [Brachybacterium sp. GPGPB12]|uniref:DUF4129 domain-containing protein n=1 Tax=Brachybacterium sp. GPGPB12 TaxID=3023517 RepID=UPI00313445A2
MIPAAPRLGPDEARERILEELAKDEYDDSPGFVAWSLGAIEDWLAHMVDGVDGSSAAQTVIAVLAGAGARRGRGAGAAAHRPAAPRAPPSPSTRRSTPSRCSAGRRARGAARDAIDAGRTDDGTVLAPRALVRDLEERTLLDVATGMTAHEAATRAALTFPDLRGRLQRGADAFDTAAYSVRSVGVKPAEDMPRLAEYIAETSPDLSALEQAGTGTPV